MWKNWRRIPKEVDPQKEEERRKEPLEREDIPAMLMAAFVTLFLPAFLLLFLISGVAYLLFCVL